MAALADPLQLDSTEDLGEPDESLIPEPEPQPKYGIRNRDLPQQLKDAIRTAITRSQQQEKFLRRIEVLHDSQLRMYERGYQHFFEGADGSWVAAVPGAPFFDADSNAMEEWGDYIDDYPIFHGFIWIIQSVLTQNGPGVVFEANDPSNSGDNQAAEAAEGTRKNFDRFNDVKKIMRDIVRMMCVSGRVVTWVETKANPAKWGRNEDGSPVKQQTASVYGCLETKVPIMAKEQSEFPYAIIYRDLDVRNAKQDHSWIAKKIKANEVGLDENNYERFHRLGILQGGRSQYQVGEAISHLVTEVNAWLRPSAFSDDEFDDPFDEAQPEDMIEDEDGPRAPTVREMIESIFTDEYGHFTGLHAVFVGKTYSEAWAESMDDVLCVAQPFAGDGQSAMAIMDPAVIAQDRFNTLMNYCAETFDFGAPSTFVLSSKMDFEAITDQAAQPFAWRQLKQLGNGTNAAVDNFYREPNPEVPESLSQCIEFLQGEYLQFVLACPPAMWGESSEDTKTASGLAQSRNQALGRMGIIWSVIVSTMARLYFQVALAVARDPDTPDQIIVPVKGGQNVTVQTERLSKGRFRCSPDEDSGFPDSTAAKRATMMSVVQLFAQFPPAAQQFFAAPENWRNMLKLLGITEMVIPEAEAQVKQVEEIEELLNSVPLEPTPEDMMAAEQQSQQGQAMYQQALPIAQQQGIPAPPPPPPFDPMTAICDPTDVTKIGSLSKPSVPIKPWDFDSYENDQCLDWLNSEACRRELEVGRAGPDGVIAPNIRGVQNVWLHALEHQKAMKVKAPPMPPVPMVAGKGKPPAAGTPGPPPLAASAPAGSPGTATI